MFDAHKNEYLGAVAGMTETYGEASRLPVVGDNVHGLAGGKAFNGQLIELSETTAAVAVDMAWLILDPSDLELD
jgi:hypothetical protein